MITLPCISQAGKHSIVLTCLQFGILKTLQLSLDLSDIDAAAWQPNINK